jgi:hypothetical protein
MVRETRGVRIAVLACALIALLPAAVARANIYNVSAGSSDAADVNTADAGVCDADPSPTVVCTLRAAVQTANSAGSPGFDTIQVPSGVYTLTIPNSGGDEDAAATGDLDLTTSMEITGIGGQGTIRGNFPSFTDRIFHIPSGSPSVTLSNLTITKGQAPDGGWGGGIKHESGSLTIVNSSITDNRALGEGARGGGIYSSGGSSLTLTDVNVNANQAPPAAAMFGAQGGGVWSQTPVNFTRVAIYSNNANFGCGASCGAYGGGLYVGGGTLTNVTVGANIVGGSLSNSGGGGIAHSGNTLTLVNSTVEQNHSLGSTGFGGGNLLDFGGGISMQGTIVSNGDTPNQTGTENCFADSGSFGSLTSLGHNLEARAGQGASQCGLSPGVNGDITAISAGLDSTLSFNGGPTPTYKLLPGSPAIDAGAPNGLTTDQRGVARPQGAVCDIGAYELDSIPPPPGWTCAGPPSSPPPPPIGTTPASPTAVTGLQAAALKKCKKKRSAAARRKCRKRAQLLPL